jgi:hypothetical protein
MSLNQVIPSTNAINNVGVFNGAVPPEGAKIIPQLLQFTAPNTGIEIDLTNIHQLGRFSGIQSVYIDNSANASPFSLSMFSTGQVIECPANSQGYFPVMLTSTLRLTGSLPVVGIVNLIIMNFAVAAAVWNVTGTTAAPAFIFDAHGFLRTTVNNTPVVPVDHSGTIAVANTAQNALAANTSRTGYRLMNTDPSAETLWFRDDGGAAVVGGPGSWPLVGGATQIGGFQQGKSGSAVSVIAATAGHQFTCVEDI